MIATKVNLNAYPIRVHALAEKLDKRQQTTYPTLGGNACKIKCLKLRKTWFVLVDTPAVA